MRGGIDLNNWGYYEARSFGWYLSADDPLPTERDGYLRDVLTRRNGFKGCTRGRLGEFGFISFDLI